MPDYDSSYGGTPPEAEQPPQPPLAGMEAEITAFTQSNAAYYIKKWQSEPPEDSMGWNWPAFLVPMFWLAYRKLYAHAAILMLALKGIGFVIGRAMVATYLANWYDYSSLNALNILSRATLIGAGVLVGLLGNKWLYKRFQEVRTIEAASMEGDAYFQHLQKQGGVSVVGVVCFIGAWILLSLFI